MATYTMYEVAKLGLRNFEVSNDHMHWNIVHHDMYATLSHLRSKETTGQ